MAKLITLGNGSTLVGLDKWGQVKDLYFHYPGLENHVSEALTHKIGFYIDSNFTWIDDGNWVSKISSKESTMASDITLRSERFGIEVHFEDVVYNEKNVFLRQVVVKNLYDRERKITVYFNSQFDISQTGTGDSAFYDPRGRVIIHYKGRRVFLVNSDFEGRGFDEYSVGLLGIEGKSGTYMDAEDGELSGNPIEHGKVDSVIGVKMTIPANDEKQFHFFICIAKSITYAKKLNEMVLSKKPERIIKSTEDYWKAWVGVRGFSFYSLGKPIIELFNRSLLTIRTHTSKNGGIIASGDSEMLQFGRDYYEYVWPRDAAFTAVALAKAGDFNTAKKFFEFAKSVITPEGYFMHKYRPDKSLGSSWHPWVRNGVSQYPIQEDETAVVIWALWEYYKISRNLEFVEKVYNGFIKKASDFMSSYLDDKTGLPKASYDLWERVYGVNTYTSASVYGALIAASKFSGLLGKEEAEKKYKDVANAIKKAILKYLYDPESKNFVKLINTGGREVDKTVDFSNVFGIYKFGVLEVNDPILVGAVRESLKRLKVNTEIGGIARYESDSYHHPGGMVVGNPWIICSMWHAQFLIQSAKKESDFKEALEIINWTVSKASESGILPEQLHAYNGSHLSASPLIWSHAEFITTIVNYLERLEDLGLCKACYTLK